MKKSMSTLPRRQRGVGMMEVLAAMFVLSVGMLGVAALQSQGIRAGQTASMRTLAVIAAKDMVERMRANPLGVAGSGGASYAATAGDAGTRSGCDDNDGATRAVACTPAALAQHDIAVWKAMLDDTLPQATGTIAVVNAANPALVTVTVNWVERGTDLSYSTITEIFTE